MVQFSFLKKFAGLSIEAAMEKSIKKLLPWNVFKVRSMAGDAAETPLPLNVAKGRLAERAAMEAFIFTFDYDVIKVLKCLIKFKVLLLKIENIN